MAILLFYGHNPENLDKGDGLSNWFPSPFMENGIQFTSNEQYMMYRKAMLFGDVASAGKILRAATLADIGNMATWDTKQKQIKKLGRDVTPFDDFRWQEHRVHIVTDGLRLKFTQNQHLKDFLINTKGTIAEASPRDLIWGIGYGKTNPNAQDPKKWRGMNLLGQCLMQVRDELADQLP